MFDSGETKSLIIYSYLYLNKEQVKRQPCRSTTHLQAVENVGLLLFFLFSFLKKKKKTFFNQYAFVPREATKSYKLYL